MIGRDTGLPDYFFGVVLMAMNQFNISTTWAKSVMILPPYLSVDEAN